MIFRGAYTGFLAAALLLAPAGDNYARAQGAPPQVEVDTSILNELNPTYGVNGNANAPLSRPARKLERPSLTGPDAYYAAPPSDAPTRFPVTTTVKSESIDPSLPPTQGGAFVSSVIEAAKANEDSVHTSGDPDALTPLPQAKAASVIVPLPPRKPRTEIAVAAIAKKPPLPKRRPDIQTASPAFVAQARREAARQIAAASVPARKAAPVRATPGGGGKPMPALPAGFVAAEILPGSIERNHPDDPFTRQILTPDKNLIIHAVEAITAGKENPVVAPVKPVLPRLVRTAAAPLQEKTRKKEEIDITAEAIAAIEPAAGEEENITDITADLVPAVSPAASPAPAAQTPRPPPRDSSAEQDYVSLPFRKGLDELDAEISAALEGRILPLLKNNPQWRLQIQAFATPDADNASSARRLSLARALSVRTWLLDQGIEARRMDVRALGMETGRDPADRVDLIFFDPEQL